MPDETIEPLAALLDRERERQHELLPTYREATKRASLAIGRGHASQKDYAKYMDALRVIGELELIAAAPPPEPQETP